MNIVNINHNIKFNYLYRDSGNYKLFNSVIFTNPNKLDLKTIQGQITKSLIDGEFFCPREWNIPALEFDTPDEELDHNWHEFESVEQTSESSEVMKKIDELLESIIDERKESHFTFSTSPQ